MGRKEGGEPRGPSRAVCGLETPAGARVALGARRVETERASRGLALNTPHRPTSSANAPAPRGAVRPPCLVQRDLLLDPSSRDACENRLPRPPSRGGAEEPGWTRLSRPTVSVHRAAQFPGASVCRDVAASVGISRALQKNACGSLVGATGRGPHSSTS